MRAIVHAGLIAAMGMGCTVGGAADLPDAALTAVAPATASAATPASAAPRAEPSPEVNDWREAVRNLDWPAAWSLLDRVDPAARSAPEMRLVRGRIALELGKYDEAVQALEGLETALPSLRDEVQRWYAEAAASAGPHDKAAALLADSPKVEDMLLAAKAWQRGGKLAQARALCDKAVHRAQRNRRKDSQAEAHWTRAAIAEAAGQKAVAAGDYRWFVQNRIDDPRVREAIAGVDRVGGVLTLGERVDALAGSASPLDIDETLAALDALLQKHPAEAQRIALARARALYGARDYARAKDAFLTFAQQPTGFAAEAMYYAARATARSGDQQRAAELYADTARRFPNNLWAERASYRHAETLLSLGRFKEAAGAFTKFSGRFPKSEHRHDARYGRAVALLSAGEAAEARKLLAALRSDADSRRDRAHLSHLEALAAARAGDSAAAKKIWLALIDEQPLTYPALAAHARLSEMGHTPMPPLMPAPRPAAASPLPVSLPATAQLLSSLGLDDTAEHLLWANEAEAAKAFPGRESEALCEMYGMLSGARRRHQVGSRAVSLDMLMRPPTEAERWAWRCVYPDAYPELVRREEKRAGLPSGFVYAIMRQESAFRTEAVSPVGAQGLMQLMPNTAKRAAAESGYDAPLDAVYRPAVNVRLGSFYLAKLLDNFAGSVPLAAAGYNAGPHAVERWLESAKHSPDTDLWIARIPFDETRNYVLRVLGNLARYQYLDGGIDNVTPLPLTVPTDVDIGADAY